MLLIPCPNCGERDESEFDYGGRALPWPGLEASLQQWHRDLHLRDNPRGKIEEHWYHAGGCECWIKIKRDLVSHEITHVTTDETNS